MVLYKSINIYVYEMLPGRNSDSDYICFRFLRELGRLKETADYQSCDPTKLDSWLKELGHEFCQHSYSMLKGGADRCVLRWLTDEQLQRDCGIDNGIHRMKIIEASKSK